MTGVARRRPALALRTTLLYAHVTRVRCPAATAPLEHSAPAVHETTAGPPGGAFATPLYPLPPIVYLLVLVWMVGSAMRSEVGPPLLSIAAILAMWPIHFACECLRRR